MQVRPLLIYKTGSTLKAALIQFDINNGLSEMCNVKAVVYTGSKTKNLNSQRTIKDNDDYKIVFCRLHKIIICQ